MEKNLREPSDAEINKNWKVNKDALKYIKAGFIGSPLKENLNVKIERNIEIDDLETKPQETLQSARSTKCLIEKQSTKEEKINKFIENYNN